MPIPQSFIYRGHRYTKIYIGGGFSKELAEQKLEICRKEAPQFLWALHKQTNGW